jgi:choline dehydrogenase
MRVYDYVVIGGGSAGCVAAAGLARGSSASVLLLEAGPDHTAAPKILDADGYKETFANDAVFWERFSAPQATCGGQRLWLGSGRVTGGSGSVNAMVYTRGAREDFDEWPQGWRWPDVAPDFETLERVLRPHRRPPTAWTTACTSAAEQAGFRALEDLNTGDLSNVIGHEWMNADGEQRRSSYVAFLRDGGPLPNLTLETHARVHRLLFNAERQITAVEYRAGGTLATVQVRREVILSAGALETPRLLLLSGVGPGEELRRWGVPAVCEVPGVGRNLHDHPNVQLFFFGGRPVDTFFPQLYSFYRTNPDVPLPAGQSDTCYVYWPAISAMKQAAQRMLPAMVLPPAWYRPRWKSLIRRGLDLAFGVPGVRSFVNRLFGIVVILGKPWSRGRLTLASTDPEATAVIDPAYYSDPRDMQTMLLGVRKAREIAARGGLAAWKARELAPGPGRRSDQALARWVQRNTITTFHYAGTCRMGTGPDAVVDARLSLHGVRGVRVADASVIPWTPVSALNAPSMLIGLRAARFALEAGERP